MPNWVFSHIEVDKKHLPMIEQIIASGGLCRHYLPMPEDITKTMSPNRIITQEEYAERVANGTTSETLDKRFGPEHYNTQAQVNDFTQRYGAPDWYGWANAHWGTKWGDCHHEIDLSMPDKVILRYESAYSPLKDSILDAFFAQVTDARYIWEEEQGFGEEYVIEDSVPTLVREWSSSEWGEEQIEEQ